MIGADRSFVTVGRSFTVAKGFSPLWGKKKVSTQVLQDGNLTLNKRSKNYCACSVKLHSSYKFQTAFSEYESFTLAVLSMLLVKELSRVLNTVDTGEPSSLVF